MKGPAQSNKEELAETLATFIAVDDSRTLVTMGALARFKEVHQVVFSKFNKEVFEHAEVIEGEEVMTLRPEEQRTQKLFVHTSKIPKEKSGRL